MKILVWIFGIIAAILMLFGLLDFLIQGPFLGVVHPANYFHVANAFLLFTIVFLLCPKEKK
ncbi:MAG: hypothetical protein H8D22_00615 [Candidatus Cloacimonetes bacterium]|nr:hypothetical protein [Candidatus Cloacimonadota bacterium]